MGLYNAFLLGAIVGKIFTGVLIGGLIPMIIAFVKRRWGIGLAAIFLSGVASILHPVISIVVGVIFLIAAIKAYPAYRG